VRSSERGVWSIIFYASVLVLVTWSSISFAAQNQQLDQKLAALEKLQGRFTFVVFGDNRTGDDVYKKIVALAMERNPAFIVNTGDMIAKPGDKEQWAAFWEMSQPITVPYFLTIGNHDAHPKVPLSEKTYLEQVDLPGNERYYSFTAGNALFVVLDSYIENEEKRIMAEQLKWLEGVLANSGKKHKIVFLHHPLYTQPGRGHHGGDCLDKYPDLRVRLQALFVKSKVDAVFAGHEHFYQRMTVDNIPHIITGGGGAPLYSKEDEGGFYHLVQVTVDNDTVCAEVIDINGKVRDRF
jgi:acid phosphatase type 7